MGEVFWYSGILRTATRGRLTAWQALQGLAQLLALPQDVVELVKVPTLPPVPGWVVSRPRYCGSVHAQTTSHVHTVKWCEKCGRRCADRYANMSLPGVMAAWTAGSGEGDWWLSVSLINVQKQTSAGAESDPHTVKDIPPANPPSRISIHYISHLSLFKLNIPVCPEPREER